MKLCELNEQIEAHDVISFDIYDTLIMRKVFHPYDIFRIVGDEYASHISFDFFAERRRAEVELRTYTDPDVYEIYAKMKDNTRASEETVQMLLRAEIVLEEKMTLPRRCVINIFNEAKKKKPVYLISDMHLPYGTIEGVLRRFCITGYRELFLSNVHKTCKKNALYRVYLDHISAGRCLHIGDNYKTDVVRPRDFGMDSYYIPSACDYFKSKNPDCIEPISMEERMKLNERVIREYQNPFI